MSPPRLGRSNRRLRTHKSLLECVRLRIWESRVLNLDKSSEQPQSPGASGNYFIRHAKRREYTEDAMEGVIKRTQAWDPGCFTATLPAHMAGSTILS